MNEPSEPLPLEPSPPTEADEKRLWIGNIDTRLNEYHLLKIAQQYGEVKKFDFLFHKAGPLKGQPRGYSFVTYGTREQAERAVSILDGKRVLGKDLVVKWAHTAPSESIDATKPKPTTTCKTVEETRHPKSAVSQILAIEAKLRAMESKRDEELEMSLAPSSDVGENPLLVNRNSVPHTTVQHHKPRSAPYSRQNRRHYKSHHR